MAVKRKSSAMARSKVRRRPIPTGIRKRPISIGVRKRPIRRK